MACLKSFIIDRGGNRTAGADVFTAVNTARPGPEAATSGGKEQIKGESHPLHQLENKVIACLRGRARPLPAHPAGGRGLAKIEGDFVKKPGVQMIAKIAKALGVSMEDLLK